MAWALIQAESIVNNSPAFEPATSSRKFRLLMSDYAQTVVMTEALPQLQELAPGSGAHRQCHATPLPLFALEIGRVVLRTHSTIVRIRRICADRPAHARK